MMCTAVWNEICVAERAPTDAFGNNFQRHLNLNLFTVRMVHWSEEVMYRPESQ